LIPGKTLADLRQIIEHDLAHEKEHERERAKEGQVVEISARRIQFELPPALTKSETRRIWQTWCNEIGNAVFLMRC